MADNQPAISIKKIQTVQLALVVLLSAGAFMAYSAEIAKAVLFGGLLAFLSFLWLQRDITRIFSGPMQVAKVLFFLKYYARLGLLAVVLFMIVKHRLFNVIGLLTGLSTVVLSIVFAGIGEVRKLHVNVKEAA